MSHGAESLLSSTVRTSVGDTSGGRLGLDEFCGSGADEAQELSRVAISGSASLSVYEYVMLHDTASCRVGCNAPRRVIPKAAAARYGVHRALCSLPASFAARASQPAAAQNSMQMLQLVKDTINKALDDKVLRLSAALSYYSIFSLAPLLLIAVSVAGAIYGEQAASGLLAQSLTSSIGADAANAVQDMVVRTRKPSDNIIASLTGVVLLVVGATGVFGQLQDALNTVWSVQQKPGKIIKTLLRDRLTSFAMVLGVGFLLLTSLILTTGLQIASDLIAGVVPVPAIIWSALSSAVSFLVVALLFGAIFRVLPDVEIMWKDVRFGALLTAGLFVLGKIVLGWYLGRAATTSVYGSAGSLVLILLWVYYSSLILLLGAEFTQVYSRSQGRTIKPSKGAVRVTRITEAVPDGVEPESSERVRMS